MLEAYSSSKTLETGSVLPFENVSLVKGQTAVLSGLGSIQLNKCGVYQITLDMTGNPGVAGEVIVSTSKDGVPQAQSLIDIPLATTDNTISASVTTLIQVSKSNSDCPCQSPVTVSFTNAGIALNNARLHVTVAKVC